MCITGIRKNTLGEAVQRAASTSVLFLCTSLLYGIIYLSDCKTMFQEMKKTKLLGGELMVKAIQEIEAGTVIVRKNDTTQGRYFTWPTVEQAKEFRAKGKRLI